MRDEHMIAVPLLMGQPSLLDAQNKLSERALRASEAQVADIETFPSTLILALALASPSPNPEP